ncbi:Retrovirus-related Pol polyprotein from transposon 17.6, partial [Mucuna pruriens]
MTRTQHRCSRGWGLRLRHAKLHGCMHPCDESKTAFMTDEGNFCYKVMPFDLKNAGATYQRLMDHIFKDHIGNQVKVYMDDMVVKLEMEGGHVNSLLSVFEVLRRHQLKLKLNPEKCSFGVRDGKFLGFVLTQRGIETNTEKC